MKQRITFDFDGVLMHSHFESMVTAYNVVSGSLIDTVEDLPPGFQDLFSQNRSHVRNAAEMTVLAEWCLAAERYASERLGRQQLENLLPDSGTLRQKESLFFATRTALFSQNAQSWFRLNIPFQPIWSCVRDQLADPLIITHKNESAVLDLCSHYGLKISEDRVFSGDGGISKMENLQRLAEIFPADKYFFIDDNYRNLIELRDDIDGILPVVLLYAAWGYGSDADAADAAAAGLEVHTQETLLALLRREKLISSEQL